MKNLLALILLFSGLAFAGTISNCTTMNSANTVYTLNTSITVTGSCMVVNASNVTLDCNGFSITGTGNGISSAKDKTTVMNCNVLNFDMPLTFTNPTNANISNSNFSTVTGSAAFSITGATNLSISKVQTNQTGDWQGFYIVSATNVWLRDISAWSDSMSYSSILIESSSNVNGTNLHGQNFLVGGWEGLELAGVTNSYFKNITGISRSADGILTGAGASNITIDGCWGQSQADDIGCWFSSLANSIVHGCYCTSAASTGGGAAMTFDSDCTGNQIYNNTLVKYNGTALMVFSSTCGNNTIYANNFTYGSSQALVDINGTNKYNTTEGNIWTQVMNGSVNITGTASSTFFPSLRVGTGGSGYPFNTTTSGNKFQCNFAGCGDYRPLIPGVPYVAPPPLCQQDNAILNLIPLLLGVVLLAFIFTVLMSVGITIENLVIFMTICIITITAIIPAVTRALLSC